MSNLRFQSFVCVGDSISWEKNGFLIKASIHYDSDTSPDDYDCYNDDTKKQWMSDEWFFGGIILSVSKNDVVISKHAASVWGVECNITDNNDYLTEIAYELEDEALNFARHDYIMTNKPIPGSVGVMLSDTRQHPRLYRLTDEPADIGLAVFAPIDDAPCRVIAPLADFWPLLDAF